MIVYSVFVYLCTIKHYKNLYLLTYQIILISGLSTKVVLRQKTSNSIGRSSTVTLSNRWSPYYVLCQTLELHMEIMKERWVLTVYFLLSERNQQQTSGQQNRIKICPGVRLNICIITRSFLLPFNLTTIRRSLVLSTFMTSFRRFWRLTPPVFSGYMFLISNFTCSLPSYFTQSYCIHFILISFSAFPTYLLPMFHVPILNRFLSLMFSSPRFLSFFAK